MKRILDIVVSLTLLTFISPILLLFIILVFLQDFNNPFYVAARVGLNERSFNMIKLRSMIVNADRNKVDSTSDNDQRITWIGKFVRKFKIDELTQLFNVLIGSMSLVGPRPNVITETNIYTVEEKFLLTVKPGITDFSSIVFSDEGKILKNSLDPDLDYNQLIRPGKSRLGLFYIKNQKIYIDLIIIYLTALSIFNRENALKGVSRLLSKLGADNSLVKLSLRKGKLSPMPPPGSNSIVQSRN